MIKNIKLAAYAALLALAVGLAPQASAADNWPDIVPSKQTVKAGTDLSDVLNATSSDEKADIKYFYGSTETELNPSKGFPASEAGKSVEVTAKNGTTIIRKQTLKVAALETVTLKWEVATEALSLKQGQDITPLLNATVDKYEDQFDLVYELNTDADTWKQIGKAVVPNDKASGSTYKIRVRAKKQPAYVVALQPIEKTFTVAAKVEVKAAWTLTPAQKAVTPGDAFSAVANAIAAQTADDTKTVEGATFKYYKGTVQDEVKDQSGTVTTQSTQIDPAKYTFDASETTYIAVLDKVPAWCEKSSTSSELQVSMTFTLASQIACEFKWDTDGKVKGGDEIPASKIVCDAAGAEFEFYKQKDDGTGNYEEKPLLLEDKKDKDGKVETPKFTFEAGDADATVTIKAVAKVSAKYTTPADVVKAFTVAAKKDIVKVVWAPTTAVKGGQGYKDLLTAKLEKANDQVADKDFEEISKLCKLVYVGSDGKEIEKPEEKSFERKTTAETVTIKAAAKVPAYVKPAEVSVDFALAAVQTPTLTWGIAESTDVADQETFAKYATATATGGSVVYKCDAQSIGGDYIFHGNATAAKTYKVTATLNPEVGYAEIAGIEKSFALKAGVINFTVDGKQQLVCAGYLGSADYKPAGQLFIPQQTTSTNGMTSATVMAIADNAFKGCSGITNLSIFSDVNFVGTDAFAGCAGLTTVDVYATGKSGGAQADKLIGKLKEEGLSAATFNKHTAIDLDWSLSKDQKAEVVCGDKVAEFLTASSSFKGTEGFSIKYYIGGTEVVDTKDAPALFPTSAAKATVKLTCKATSTDASLLPAEKSIDFTVRPRLPLTWTLSTEKQGEKDVVRVADRQFLVDLLTATITPTLSKDEAKAVGEVKYKLAGKDATIDTQIAATAEDQLLELEAYTAQSDNWAPAKTTYTLFVPKTAAKGLGADDGTSALDTLQAQDDEVVSTVYYTVSGAAFQQPVKGLNIRVETLANGQRRATKLLVK